MEMHDIVQEAGIKTISKKMKCKMAKWLSKEALQIAEKRKDVKDKGGKEGYTHLNAELQRIARRDKKAFLSDQYKKLEENNRMRKTRDLFKKIRDTKETFHAKMDTIKDRNCMDLRELDCEESWVPKNWCFWTVVLEKTLESPLDCKEIQPVHPKGDQGWVFIGRSDVEVETPILWPPDMKNWLIGKDPDAGKDWGQEEKETTEDEMVGWHHWLDGHGFG